MATYSDSFTAADATPLPTHNAAWSVYSSSAVVRGNAAQSDSGFLFVIHSGSLDPDQEASATIASAFPAPGGLNEGFGTFVRFNSGTVSGYYCVCLAGGTQIMPLVGGTPGTVIASNAVGWANGDRITFRAVGNTLTVYKNGVSVLTGSDSNFASGTCGIVVGNQDARLDDYEATDELEPEVYGHVAFTAAFAASSDNAPTVNKPAGAGTFYVLTIRHREDLTITWPAGFTQVRRSDPDGTMGLRASVAIRAYTGTEGATFAATTSGWAPWQARCDLLDTVTALADDNIVSGYAGYTSSATLNGPAVDVSSGQYVFWIGCVASSGTANTPSFTPPSGFTAVGVADNTLGNVIAAAQRIGAPASSGSGFNGSMDFTAGDTLAGFVATLVFDGPAAPMPPTITTHPSNQTVTEGQTANFTAAATDADSVIWQLDTGVGWYDIGDGSGYTTNTYTTPTTTLAMDGSQVRAAYTNANGTSYTNAATLTVEADEPPPAPRRSSLMMLGVG